MERDKNRLSLFKPNPGFQEAFQKSKKLLRLVTSGNQSGKTHVAAVEFAQYALGCHPYKKIRTPNISTIVSGQGFKTGIEQIIVPKLLEVTGSGDIRKLKKNSQGTPVAIGWSSNSVTYLMSSEQDDDVFEGTKTDFAWVDEPIRREIFIALKRGMITTGGHFWMTCTPLDQPWIYEELYLKGTIHRYNLSNKKYETQEGEDKDIDVFEGCSDENIIITEKDKAEFKSRLTEDEIEARWFGKFKHLAGRVIKSYNPQKHLINSFDIPSHWPVWASIDPHTEKPHAVLFLAISPKEEAYVCNEIWAKVSIPKLSEYILDLSSQYNMQGILIDTSAQEDDWRRESARELLQKNGVRTKLAQKNRLKKSGIILINERFGSDKLFVMRHCVRTSRELQNWIYKKNKKDTSQILEEPENKWDDNMSNLRYILVERPKFNIRSFSIQEVGPLYGRK